MMASMPAHLGASPDAVVAGRWQRRLAQLTTHLLGRGSRCAAAAAAGAAAEEGPIIRVAMLGARARATSAARAYHAHPRCEIVGVCDLVGQVRDKLSDELGVPPELRFADLDQMIEQTRPHIVAIPVATELHHTLCMRVLERHPGVAIDVEKPLCATLEQADEVVQLARDHNTLTAVHHQGRCGRALRTVQEMLRSGRIGKLRHIIASDKGYYGGYGLMNIGTHLVNNMLGIAGHVRSVTAVATTCGRPITPHDVLPSPSGMGIIAGENITATLSFSGDVTATLLLERFEVSNSPSSAYGMELIGTEGRLFWKTHGVWVLPHPHFTPSDGTAHGLAGWAPVPLVEHATSQLPAGPGQPVKVEADESDFGFADEFVRALDEQRRQRQHSGAAGGGAAASHECSGEEATRVMEVLMGVFESAAYQRTVHLPQADRGHPLVSTGRFSVVIALYVTEIPRMSHLCLSLNAEGGHGAPGALAARERAGAPRYEIDAARLAAVARGRGRAAATPSVVIQHTYIT
jgi:predicted dehydrogenase